MHHAHLNIAVRGKINHRSKKSSEFQGFEKAIMNSEKKNELGMCVGRGCSKSENKYMPNLSGWRGWAGGRDWMGGKGGGMGKAPRSQSLNALSLRVTRHHGRQQGGSNMIQFPCFVFLKDSSSCWGGGNGRQE